MNPHAPGHEKIFHDRGRALLIQTRQNEFFLSGSGVKVDFILRPASCAANPFAQLTSRMNGTLNFPRVEEGHFDGGVWTVDYVRNGDEANFAVYVHGGQTVRVLLNR